MWHLRVVPTISNTGKIVEKHLIYCSSASCPSIFNQHRQLPLQSPEGVYIGEYETRTSYTGFTFAETAKRIDACSLDGAINMIQKLLK